MGTHGQQRDTPLLMVFNSFGSDGDGPYTFILTEFPQAARELAPMVRNPAQMAAVDKAALQFQRPFPEERVSSFFVACQGIALTLIGIFL